MSECNFYKGVTHQLFSQFDEELKSLDNELFINPNHVNNSLVSKGAIYCILNKKEERIAEFDKALKIETNKKEH